MKKLILTLSIALASYFSYAQNAPLYLWGTGLDGSIYQTSAIYSDASNGLLIEGPLNSSGVKLPITLSWRGGGSPFTINPSGNIGIGTATPGGKLTVNGNNIIATNTASSATANETTLTLNPANDFGTAGGYANLGPSISGFIESAGNPNIPSGLKFYTYSGGTQSNRITILGSNGNVGIGTASPAGKLHVQPSAYDLLTGLYTVDIGLNGTTYGWARAFRVVNSSNSNGQDGGAFGVVGSGTSPGYAYMSIPTSDPTGYNSTKILALDNAGNVSIGTTNPQGYKLAVNGNAIAESLTVKLHGSWPDYVFKSKYNLLPLTEVKKYIDNNQHLPEMPSEAEVKEKGINLGEIVKVQTKKIEELTLYMIEKDNQVREQGKQLSEQQKQIELLKQQTNRIATLEAALSKLTTSK